jgi:hypothetical protein
MSEARATATDRTFVRYPVVIRHRYFGYAPGAFRCDLGDQATAIFETSLGFPEVDLYALLGNAQIEMSFGDLPFSPTLSRDEKLAADIAMIRDVLAGLPRT